MSESIALNPIAPETVRAYELLSESCGILQLNDFGILEFTGEDRKAWLQGQVTNDMRKVDVGTSIAFCICTPTGQIVADCELWAFPNRFIVLCPLSVVPAVLSRVETMVIMEDVVCRDITANFDHFTVQGVSATRELSQLTELPTLDASPGSINGHEALCLRSRRTVYGGWDVLLPAGKGSPLEDFQHLTAEALDIARIEAGIPKFGVDMTEKTLPPELGPAFESRYISYSKGCYTGQEVLMRIHSRGHTNKTWVGLFTNEPVLRGATISHGGRPDAGLVTSVADSPRLGPIAAGFVRNEAASTGDLVQIAVDEKKVEGEVQIMPLLRLG